MEQVLKSHTRWRNTISAATNFRVSDVLFARICVRWRPNKARRASLFGYMAHYTLAVCHRSQRHVDNAFRPQVTITFGRMRAAPRASPSPLALLRAAEGCASMVVVVDGRRLQRQKFIDFRVSPVAAAAQQQQQHQRKQKQQQQ